MSSASSKLSTDSINEIVQKLKSERYRNSTRQTYYRVWKLFNQFFIRLDKKPDDWEDRIVLFAGFLIENKMQSSSVKSYLSAIKAMLAESGIKLQEDQFLLSSLTKACKIKNDHLFTRLPIRKGMLNLLLLEVSKLYGMAANNQPYLEKLYKAILVTGYYGLMRVGELTKSPHVVLARNVHMGVNKNKILFVLLSSKTHSQGSHPQMIKISYRPLQEECKHKLVHPKLDQNSFKIFSNFIDSRPPQR